MLQRALFTLAAFMLILPTATGQQQPLIPDARNWELANGKPAPQKAVMLSASKDSGTFQIISSDSRTREVQIPWNRLSPTALTAARIAWADHDDETEFAKMRDHLVAFEQLPASKSDIFKIYFKNPTKNPFATSQSLSPYAGLWASVGMAAGENDPKQAKLILDKVIKRIQLQQELDPSRHKMTLSSAYNNLAIINLKNMKGDSAANYFIKAIDAAGYLSPVVRHNASQLSEYVDDGGKMKLGVNQREKLLKSIALVEEIQGHQTQLPTGWLYSLDFDLPAQSFGAKRVIGIDPPIADMELVGMASGVVLANGYVVTSRAMFDRARLSSGDILVSVGEPNPNSKSGSDYRSVNVTQMFAEYSGVFRSFAFATNNGVTRTFTTYQRVTPRPGEPSGEIVALEAPGLKVRPAPITDEAPGIGDLVTILSYRRGPDILQKGLQARRANVLEAIRVGNRKAHIQIDQRIEGGDRGGAIMDGLNAVCGIAFDYGDNAGEGKFFEIESVRRWIDVHVPTAQLEQVNVRQLADYETQTRAAVVPVFIWGKRSAENSTIYSQVADSSTASSGLYIRDPWCMQCSGTGMHSCPACSGGVIAKKTRTQVGRNPATGAILYGNKVTREKCPNCSGAGGFKCPYCQNGLLKK